LLKSQEIELGESEQRYSTVYEHGNWGVSRQNQNIEILWRKAFRSEKCPF